MSTKHPEDKATRLEISEGAMYGYRIYKVIDVTDPKNRIIFCDCYLNQWLVGLALSIGDQKR